MVKQWVSDNVCTIFKYMNYTINVEVAVFVFSTTAKLESIYIHLEKEHIIFLPWSAIPHASDPAVRQRSQCPQKRAPQQGLQRTVTQENSKILLEDHTLS